MNGRRSLLAAGVAALGRWRLVALLTAATALLALLGAAPLWPALDAAFSRTLAGNHVLLNHPTFAPTDVFDFLHEKSSALLATRQSAAWTAILAVLLQVFFAGGIATTLGRPDPPPSGAFWAACRLHFGHNLKCLLLFGAAALLVPGLVLGAGLWAVKKAYEDAPPWAAGPPILRFGLSAAALLLFGALSVLYDFARAGRRSDPCVGALRAFGRAFRRLSGSWLRALAVAGLWALVGAAAALALFALAWAGSPVSGAGIALQALLQAGIVAARSAGRVAAWGSELALYDERTPAPAPSSGV